VGTILLVHGLGEHIGRYEHVAAHLTARGWNVVGYDQRGHGRSDGKRGALTTAGDLLDDLCLVTDHVRATEGGAATPCVLFGHSMGGLVAAQFVAHALRPVDGLVLTSPALDPGLSFGQRAQLSIGLALVPDMAMSNQLDPSFTSHDPAVVRAYRDDPLVHDRVTARLAKALVDGGREVLAAAPVWRVPTLLMWAGADRIVAPAGSAAFAAAAPVEVVRTRCFDDLYHEILNEQEAGPVFGMLDEWLDEWLDDRVPR
jgi:alpha-beta hydrolase superfamily lysophospholipase